MKLNNITSPLFRGSIISMTLSTRVTPVENAIIIKADCSEIVDDKPFVSILTWTFRSADAWAELAEATRLAMLASIEALKAAQAEPTPASVYNAERAAKVYALLNAWAQASWEREQGELSSLLERLSVL